MPRDKDLHPPEEIEDYIRRNYDGLGNAKGMSIGLVGGRYRVAVVDSQRIIHTLHIDPKEIDADRESKLKQKARGATPKTRDDNRLARALKLAAACRAKQGRSTDRDRDR